MSTTNRRLAFMAALSAMLVIPGTVVAEQLVLKAPPKSDDGSYVLRVEADETAYQSERQGRQLEVYRNKDGGEFKRIMVGPRFTALSELVRENGTYGYKARWVAIEDGDQVAVDQRFTDAVYVTVTSAVPRTVPPRKDRLASTTISQYNRMIP